MLTPYELLHISEGAEEIAESLHQDIIKRIIDRIMLRIGRGEEYLLTSVDKWQIETLQQAGYLLEDIQKEIAKKTKLQETEIAEAMEDAGVVPKVKPIRGGTDGARLSYMGLPTPNIFTGGENFHGKYEYIAIESMEKAVEVILNIVKIYSK